MFAVRLLSASLRAPGPSPLPRLAASQPSSAACFVASPSLLRLYSAAAPGDDAKALKDQLKTALKTAMKARDSAQTGIVKVRLPAELLEHSLPRHVESDTSFAAFSLVPNVRA